MNNSRPVAIEKINECHTESPGRKIRFSYYRFFLVFAIPLPYTMFRVLTFPLQLFSTEVTHTIITTLGVSALRQGNIIYLSNYSLEVIEACSGLRSIITLSALAAMFSYMSSGGIMKKSALFATAIPIAITANIVRLLVTVMGALSLGPEFADGFLHEVSGILVFLTGLFLFFLTEKIFTRISKIRIPGLTAANL